VIDVSVWMCVVNSQLSSNCYSYNIFWQFFKISNLDLVCGTVAAELSELTGFSSYLMLFTASPMTVNSTSTVSCQLLWLQSTLCLCILSKALNGWISILMQSHHMS